MTTALVGDFTNIVVGCTEPDPGGSDRNNGTFFPVSGASNQILNVSTSVLVQPTDGTLLTCAL